MNDAMSIAAELRNVPGIKDSAVALPVRLARARAAAEGIAMSKGVAEAGRVAYIAAHHAAGYGEVSMLLDDPKISNIMINVRRAGAVRWLPKGGTAAISLPRDAIAGIIGDIERDTAATSCNVRMDVRAPGGIAVLSRVPARCTPKDLIARKFISAEELAYIWMAIESGANIAVVGNDAGIMKTMRAAASLLRPCDTAAVVSDCWKDGWVSYGPRLISCGSLEWGEEIDVDRIIVEELNPKHAALLFRRAVLGQPFIAGMKGDGSAGWIEGLAAKPYSVETAMLSKLGVVVKVGERIEEISECRWFANCDGENAEFTSPDIPFMLRISQNGVMNMKAQRISVVMRSYSAKYANTTGESFDELRKRAAFLKVCENQNTDSYWTLQKLK